MPDIVTSGKQRAGAERAADGSRQAVAATMVGVRMLWLRNPQFWRLASGLVLFLFVSTHFLNHALGLVSLDAMEAVQVVRRGVWRSWPGSVLLYGAVAVHVALVLWKLVQRRTWRMPGWEAVQIALGLGIPLLAVAHVVTTRGLNALHGVDDTYTRELRLLWSASALGQSVLLVVVWLHATIGLHHWLRPRPWYPAWRPSLLVAAVLVPTLALTGWIEAARRVAAMRFDEMPLSGALLSARAHLIAGAEAGIWGLAALVLGAILVSRLVDRLHGGPMITYPAGRRVKAPRGATLLEVSRAAGVPHASVCGGRARCTTCRVLILEGAGTLAPPDPTEARALARIAAPSGVRLACQIRPTHSLSVRPLVPMGGGARTAPHDALGWGVEASITVVFADLRGFTSLAEKLYPYDAVFLLSRYFDVMTQVIGRKGGEVDKLLGDGVMAVFGIGRACGSGSRDALAAAQGMLEALDALNQEFANTLSEPLRMGIGIHTGSAVLGRVGGQGRLTALGDSVNIASRLEALNKAFGSLVVASDATLSASGVSLTGAKLRRINVRGRAEPLVVHVIHEGSTLARANAAAARAAPGPG